MDLIKRKMCQDLFAYFSQQANRPLHINKSIGKQTIAHNKLILQFFSDSHFSTSTSDCSMQIVRFSHTRSILKQQLYECKRSTRGGYWRLLLVKNFLFYFVFIVTLRIRFYCNRLFSFWFWFWFWYWYLLLRADWSIRIRFCTRIGRRGIRRGSSALIPVIYLVVNPLYHLLLPPTLRERERGV